MVNAVSVSDFRALARRRQPAPLFHYVDGGCGDETTMGGNETALQALRLRQRVLRDVSRVDTTATVLGQSLRYPLVLAPCGLAGMLARRGEVQAARAADAAGVPFCLSTVSICSIEEMTAAGVAPFWFQLYVMSDHGLARELLQRAQAAACPVLVFTVDLAVVGQRHHDYRSGLVGETGRWQQLRLKLAFARRLRWTWDVGLRGRPHTFGNLASVVPHGRQLSDFREWVHRQHDAGVTWKDLAWIRERWPGKLVIKGVLDAQDARAAADVGADAVVVSNHGGRQLDGAPAPVTVLPEVVDAVGDRVEVLVDGGVRSGSDIARALALGARACLIGRPWLYGLGAAGQAGVAAVLALLQSELEITLALTGTSRAADLDRGVLYRTP